MEIIGSPGGADAILSSPAWLQSLIQYSGADRYSKFYNPYHNFLVFYVLYLVIIHLYSFDVLCWALFSLVLMALGKNAE